MKRFLTLCALALAGLGASEQQASAWCKFGLNVGASVNFECANSNLLWGAIRNGPAPFGDNQIGWDSYGCKHGQAYPQMNCGYGYGAPTYDYMPSANMLPMPAQSSSVPAVYNMPVSYWSAPVYYYSGY